MIPKKLQMIYRLAGTKWNTKQLQAGWVTTSGLVVGGGKENCVQNNLLQAGLNTMRYQLVAWVGGAQRNAHPCHRFSCKRPSLITSPPFSFCKVSALDDRLDTDYWDWWVDLWRFASRTLCSREGRRRVKRRRREPLSRFTNPRKQFKVVNNL